MQLTLPWRWLALTVAILAGVSSYLLLLARHHEVTPGFISYELVYDDRLDDARSDMLADTMDELHFSTYRDDKSVSYWESHTVAVKWIVAEDGTHNQLIVFAKDPHSRDWIKVARRLQGELASIGGIKVQSAYEAEAVGAAGCQRNCGHYLNSHEQMIGTL